MKKAIFALLTALFLLIPGSASAKDIVDTAVSAGSFKTLAAALDAAGLVDTLKGKGPFTVFAPTDEAFAKIPKDQLKDLLRPENKDQLIAILTYHVVPGRVRGRDAASARRAATVQGERLRFSLADGRLTVNNVNVVKNDIETDNGVIHVIDQVLIPKKKISKAQVSSEAQRIIELAIKRGVPLYNRGDADACAAVYEVATEGLLNLDDAMLTSRQRRALKKAKKKARRTHDLDRRAWIYREALDKVYGAMDRMAKL